MGDNERLCNSVVTVVKIYSEAEFVHPNHHTTKRIMLYFDWGLSKQNCI